MRKPSGNRLNSLMALLKLPQLTRLFISLLGDRRVSLWLKLAAAAGAVYVFSPLDVIPDFTGIGWLDDIVLTLLIMQTLVDLTPRHVVEEHCERLGINPEDVIVNIPMVVTEAIELLAAWWTSASVAKKAFSEMRPSHDETGHGSNAGPAPRPAADPSVAASAAATAGETPPAAAASGRTTVETPPAAPKPSVPPTARRYSAYREGEN